MLKVVQYTYVSIYDYLVNSSHQTQQHAQLQL